MQVEFLLVLERLDNEVMIQGGKDLGFIGEMKDLLFIGGGYIFQGKLSGFGCIEINLRIGGA